MHDESQQIVIVSAARTPVGKFQGALSAFSATELGALAVRAAVTAPHSIRSRSMSV